MQIGRRKGSLNEVRSRDQFLITLEVPFSDISCQGLHIGDEFGTQRSLLRSQWRQWPPESGSRHSDHQPMPTTTTKAPRRRTTNGQFIRADQRVGTVLNQSFFAPSLGVVVSLRRGVAAGNGARAPWLKTSADFFAKTKRAKAEKRNRHPGHDCEMRPVFGQRRAAQNDRAHE